MAESYLANITCLTCDRLVFADLNEAIQHFQEKAHGKRFRHYSASADPEPPIVFVNRLGDLSAESILTYFSNLGPLVSALFKYEHGSRDARRQRIAFCFVEFEFELAAKGVLAVKDHIIEGQRVTVFKKRHPPLPNLNEEENVNVPEILSKMSSIENPDDQVMLVTRMAELTLELTEARSDVIQSLENAFKKIAPKLEVLPFGSSQSGLSLKGGDLDCYIKFDLTDDVLKNAKMTFQEIEQPIAFKRKNLQKRMGKNSSDCEQSDNNPPKELKSFSGRSLSQLKLAFLWRILHRHERIFSQTKFISKAQTPIVKFTHVKTGIACDLNCSNRMAYLNTQFIYTILACDMKLRPLLIFLKVWSKEAKLIGLGSSGCLTSYAFVILILVYLQKEQYLPKVTEFHAANPRVMVEGWDFGFTRSLSRLKRTSKKIEFLPVLLGLFEFLSTFNFERDYICARTAEIHPKSELKPDQVVPVPEREDQFILLDPFEQTRNICKLVKRTSLIYFTRVCEQALNYLRSPNGSKLDGLFTLETCDNFTQPKVDLELARSMSVAMRFSNVNNLASLVQERVGEQDKVEHLMNKLILKILSECLLLKSKVFNSESQNPGDRLRAALLLPPETPKDFELQIDITINSNEEKVEESTKRKTDPQHLTTCRFYGYFNTWKGRSKPNVKDAQAKGVNLLGFEIQKVNNKFKNQSEPSNPLVEFDFISSLVNNQINIRCVPVSEVNNDLKSLFSFLQEYLYAVCVGILFCEKNAVKPLFESCLK